MPNIGNYSRPLKCNKCGKIINEIAYSESGDEEHIYCRKWRPLKCNKCGKIINEIAYSESGDEEHIYCRKCWADTKTELLKR
jgi:DNA-directed RNA polymerase subunit N (RpoN/RPB10)